MATYRRTGTSMDRVAMFTPQSLARVRGTMRAYLPAKLRGLRALGQDEFGDDFGSSYGALSDASSTEPAGWNWQGMLDKAPQMMKDLYIAKESGDMQARLLEINLERSRRGLPPISAASVAPQVNFGVAPQTMNMAGMGIGGLIGLAALAYFGGKALTR